nr:IS630 family transposase [Rudanella paleaurantiibacter]
MAKMEAVLDFYAQPTDSQRPRLCFDERPCQLLADVLAPLPVQPGKAAKQDNEYVRNGTAVVLLAYDLDTGQRYVQVRQRRTKRDYAEFMHTVLTERYPNVNQLHVLQDNLNTHQAGSFYERFDAVTAHELAHQFVWHYTPKHGSWLNMAEIEFAALSKQCLDRRIGDIATLEKEVLAWVEERNRQAVKINWLFDTPQARKRLKRHYTKINPENSTIIDSTD